jgi:HAD superfamily hydrolase (TIGR01459 family)
LNTSSHHAGGDDPAARAAPRFLTDVTDLAARYRAFLLDQWGVLHDGQRPYPGAVKALEHLRSSGARILMLSNTAKTEASNIGMLTQMGFAADLYDGIVTAGDDARNAVTHDSDEFYRSLGPRCLPLSRPNERALAQCPGYTLVDTVEDADWLFLISMEPPRESIASWHGLLERAAARGLPMVCGNPDLHRATQDRGLLEAPGQVAACYAGLGGVVRLHGKPEPGVYRTALARLGVERDQIVAVGDSLPHDGLGAVRAGIAYAWVAGGVHLKEIGYRWGDRAGPDPARCEALFERYGIRPGHVLPVWG